MDYQAANRRTTSPVHPLRCTQTGIGHHQGHKRNSDHEFFVYQYEQYHYATKALRELRRVGEALEERVLKPTTLRGARWVPYIHRAVTVSNNSKIIIQVEGIYFLT